jgi:hypothetical protein
VCGGEGQREEASHGEECNARQGVKEEGGDALHALVEIEAGLGVIMSQKRERWKRLVGESEAQRDGLNMASLPGTARGQGRDCRRRTRHVCVS